MLKTYNVWSVTNSVLGFWNPSRFQYTWELNIIGVFLVNEKAVILICHVYGDSVYVIYEATSPGNPISPSGSKREKVMEVFVTETTVKFR